MVKPKHKNLLDEYEGDSTAQLAGWLWTVPPLVLVYLSCSLVQGVCVKRDAPFVLWPVVWHALPLPRMAASEGSAAPFDAADTTTHCLELNGYGLLGAVVVGVLGAAATAAADTYCCKTFEEQPKKGS